MDPEIAGFILGGVTIICISAIIITAMLKIK